MATQSFSVPGMSCGHCVQAVESEVARVSDVESVVADLGTKLVRVTGEGVDEAAVRAAIADAGYEVE